MRVEDSISHHTDTQVETGAIDMTVGVMYWEDNDGIASLISGILKRRGCEVVNFVHDAVLPADVDVVLAYAPFGSLTPLARQLLSRPTDRRPLLALWLTEPLPNPRLPEWFRRGGGAIRSAADRLAYTRTATGIWQRDPGLGWLTSSAFRYRYYGDLFWLRQQGLLSVLAVTSRIVADFLHDRGFDPILAYLGAHPDWWADLHLKRDIPVLWLGKMATDRRRRILNRVRTELRERGVEILVVDGLENPYIFGHERTVLLNRTVVALNLLRQEHDNNGMRFFLAASNRALILTEPTLPHTPFLPNVHLIEAPVDQMAETICFYLANENARAKIVEEAHRLATDNLTMEKSLDRIFQLGIVPHLRK